MTRQQVQVVAAPATPGVVVAFGRCELRRLPSFPDDRGVLAVTETGTDLPFAASRCFFIYGVPDGARRGGHSLATTAEVMIGVHGAVNVDVDDGTTRWRAVLDDPTIALHVPAGVWCEEHSFSEGAVLMVLASRVYDAAEFDTEPPAGSVDA